MSDSANNYIGKVRVAFVGCPGGKKQDDFSWTPVDHAFIEIHVDETSYRLDIGTFHDGKAERRGIHIIGKLGMQSEKTSLNACSVWQEDFKL